MEVLGIEGAMLRDATGSPTRTFSLASITSTLGIASRRAGPLACGWLQTLFALYCVVLPLGWHVALVVTWLVRPRHRTPQRDAKLRRVLRCVEVCYAFDGLCVFLLTLFLITPRLEEQETHTLGDEFLAIDRLLLHYSHELPLPGGASGHHVIAVRGATLGGFWLLSAVMLAANLLALYMIRTLNASLEPPRRKETP